MDKEIIDKLSNLSMLGYYDPSFKLLCVHFFGDDTKNDLMAYLNPDSTWDLREVISDQSELFFNHEVIKVEHSRLGTFEPGSKFDSFIRGGLKALIDDEYIKDPMVKEVLEQGYVV
jgi:hypothetical protein